MTFETSRWFSSRCFIVSLRFFAVFSASLLSTFAHLRFSMLLYRQPSLLYSFQCFFIVSLRSFEVFSASLQSVFAPLQFSALLYRQPSLL